ncbi:MAG: response regulator [Patescibacteria group bacterium]|nr:response regulator [Patescibacteria group bacterium]
MDKKTILIIEDEQGMRDTLKESIENAGYQTIIAGDGEKGIKLAKQYNCDLILLDIILPKKDGFEVLRELKMDEKMKDLPIVLITNLSEPSDIQKALDLGATTYLVKSSYSLADIVEKINNILEEQKN